MYSTCIHVCVQSKPGNGCFRLVGILFSFTTVYFPAESVIQSPTVCVPLPHLSPQLQYYGLIKQWTGEDWENASISLSTAQPSIGGSAPDLPTRIIRFWRPLPNFMISRPQYFGGSFDDE